MTAWGFPLRLVIASDASVRTAVTRPLSLRQNKQDVHRGCFQPHENTQTCKYAAARPVFGHLRIRPRWLCLMVAHFLFLCKLTDHDNQLSSWQDEEFVFQDRFTNNNRIRVYKIKQTAIMEGNPFTHDAQCVFFSWDRKQALRSKRCFWSPAAVAAEPPPQRD